MNQYVNPWTPARIEFVSAQWKAGFSAGQIALSMGGGFSRSSIIGKVHRLGLGGRGQPNQRLPKGSRHVHRVTGPRQRAEYFARSYTPPKEKFPLLPRPVSLPEPVSKHLSLLQLTDHTCKYTSDDGAPWTFCGALTTPDSNWCSFHRRLVYQPGRVA